MDLEFERQCNNEEVPFMDCEDTCCEDCSSAYSCTYVCSDLGIYGKCNRYE